jgi:DNA processing protein
MNERHAALVALLRTRSGGGSWRKLTDEILEFGDSRVVWDLHHPPQIFPSPDAEEALAGAQHDLQAWQSAGLRFVGVEDDDFPQRLLDIMETPPFLFVQGELKAEDPGLSVVGSRKASPRGLDMAARIAEFLVRENLTVISGLADGVDAAAHRAALDAGGRTAAFIATGVMRVYPAKHRQLQAEVADRGLVLSQFWPDSPPQKQNFLMRNALMSGYGLATIVVEAGETSGARAQARMAVEHGRPVILTDHVVRSNHWAQALMERPGVHMVSGLRDLGPLVENLRSEPLRLRQALKQLAHG